MSWTRCAFLILLVAVATPAAAQDLRPADYGLEGDLYTGRAQVRAHPRWSGKLGVRFLRDGQTPLVLRGHRVPTGVLFVFPHTREGLANRLEGARADLSHATALVQSSLRLRDRAAFDATTVERAAPGETYAIVRRSGEWIGLRVGAQTLYGHRDYLAEVSGPSSATWLAGRRTALLTEGPDGSWSGAVRDGQTPVGSLTLRPEPRATSLPNGAVTFAAIDLTPDVDGRDFVARAERFGLRNLVDLVPGRRDVAHPRMSLQGGVVSPYGRVAWKTEEDSETGQSYKREVSPFDQDVAQENIRTAREWITQPGVRVSGSRGQLLGTAAEDGVEVEGATTFADFLFVSSHGYTDGEIRAAPRFADAVIPTDPFASVPFRPFDPQLLRVTSLSAGLRWTNGKTRWAMLALCNVLRREYWHDWASALLDEGGMRGVLGYDSGSPKPDGTTLINKRFFEGCARGMPIVEAWRWANEVEKIFSWCAIVREDALGDRLSDWVRTGDLPPRRADTRVLYFSFKRAERNGVPVAASSAPLPQLDLSWTTQGQPLTVEHGRLGGGLVPGTDVTLHVGGLPRPLRDDDKVRVTFVNIRENYWHGPGRHELELDRMFAFEEGAVIDRDRKHQPRERDTVVLEGRDSLTMTLKPGEDGLLSMVKADEAYLWVQVSVRDRQNRLVAEGSTMGAQLVVRAEGTDPFGR